MQSPNRRSDGKSRGGTVGRTKFIATASMFVCLALIFSYVEALIPFSVGIPGIKLGLANIITLILLQSIYWK